MYNVYRYINWITDISKHTVYITYRIIHVLIDFYYIYFLTKVLIVACKIDKSWSNLLTNL